MDDGPQETECAVTVDSRFRGNDEKKAPQEAGAQPPETSTPFD